MVNTKPILGDMRLNVTVHPEEYEVFNGETWEIMDDYDVIQKMRSQNSKLQTDLDVALSYIKQYELQVKDLKQQVAFLQDWRDTWAPFLKAITEKVNDERK
jgi:hypothetical protein